MVVWQHWRDMSPDCPLCFWTVFLDAHRDSMKQPVAKISQSREAKSAFGAGFALTPSGALSMF
jgi:hypothetical protein